MRSQRRAGPPALRLDRPSLLAPIDRGGARAKAKRGLPCQHPAFAAVSRRRSRNRGDMFEAEATWLERLLRAWAPERAVAASERRQQHAAISGRSSSPGPNSVCSRPLRAAGDQAHPSGRPRRRRHRHPGRHPLRRRPAADHGRSSRRPSSAATSSSMCASPRALARRCMRDRRARRADLRDRAAAAIRITAIRSTRCTGPRPMSWRALFRPADHAQGRDRRCRANPIAARCRRRPWILLRHIFAFSVSFHRLQGLETVDGEALLAVRTITAITGAVFQVPAPRGAAGDLAPVVDRGAHRP